MMTSENDDTSRQDQAEPAYGLEALYEPLTPDEQALYDAWNAGEYLADAALWAELRLTGRCALDYEHGGSKCGPDCRSLYAS
jgi:hypothetical protein